MKHIYAEPQQMSCIRWQM